MQAGRPWSIAQGAVGGVLGHENSKSSSEPLSPDERMLLGSCRPLVWVWLGGGRTNETPELRIQL